MRIAICMCINILLGAVAQKYHKKGGEKFRSLKSKQAYKKNKNFKQVILGYKMETSERSDEATEKSINQAVDSFKLSKYAIRLS